MAVILSLFTTNCKDKSIQIVYNTNVAGNDEIFIMDEKGLETFNLTNNNFGDFYAQYSRANGRVLFYSNRDENNEIYSMKIDGTDQTRLTNNNAYDAYGSWSPDGTKIVYNSNREGNYDLHIMDANGKNDINITKSSSVDRQPVWSPDGKKIAFFSSKSREDFGIYTINIDGSNKTKLTDGLDTHPRWSLDGNRIIFDRRENNINYIYVMKKDGTEQKRLIESENCKHATFISDDVIVFSCISANSEIGKENIFIKDLKSDEIKQITKNNMRNIHPESVRY